MKELSPIEHAVFKPCGLTVSHSEADLESEGYAGADFRLGRVKVKFRKARVTPKKNGQFVALWQRNASGQTEPFHVDHDTDFYFIAAQHDHGSGFFAFTKAALAQHGVLASGKMEGKRGFRVYPEWDVPASGQAQRSRAWQIPFFIDLSDRESPEKFRRIFSEGQHQIRNSG